MVYSSFVRRYLQLYGKGEYCTFLVSPEAAG